MRTTLLFTAMLAVGLAASAQVRKSDNPRRQLLSVQVGDFDCRVVANGSKRACKDIPIVVLFDGAKCIAHVPMHELKIDTDKSEKPVTWALIGPPGYTFRSDGIELVPNASPPLVGDVWKGGQVIGGGTGYQWKLKHPAVKASFNFKAHVIGPNGDCEEGDPIITNDAN